MDLQALGLVEGSPVIAYLQGPSEKVWGLLLAMTQAGIVLRGIDLMVFDDWMRQEARGDDNLLGLTTVFYPMHRVLRMEKDEPIGPLPSCADRFARMVGRTVTEVAGGAAPVAR